MSNKQVTQAAGRSFPFASILLLIFIVMKLAGIGAVANWSWFWVLSPFWIPLAFVLICLLVFFIFTLALIIFSKK